jgi:hypothetical protein
LNALTAIPESLIAVGRTSYKARVGPTSILAIPQGDLQITRSDQEISLESQRYGKLTLSGDDADPARVNADIPNEGRYPGRVVQRPGGFVFEADSGHRLELSASSDKVEIRFVGFGALDAMKLFLKRV